MRKHEIFFSDHLWTRLRVRAALEDKSCADLIRRFCADGLAALDKKDIDAKNRILD